MRFEPTGAGWQAQTDPLCYDGRHSNFSYVNLCSFYISKNNNTTQLSLNCAFGKWYLHKILCLVQLCKLMFYVLMFFNVSPEICWQKTFMTFSLGSSLQLLVVNWKKFPCKFKWQRGYLDLATAVWFLVFWVFLNTNFTVITVGFHGIRTKLSEWKPSTLTTWPPPLAWLCDVNLMKELSLIK